MKNRSFIIAASLIWVQAAFSFTGESVLQFDAPSQCPTGLTWDGTSLWMSDRKSESNSRETVRFAQRTRDDEATIESSVLQQFASMRYVREVDIGFVQHQQPVIRKQLHQ